MCQGPLGETVSPDDLRIGQILENCRIIIYVVILRTADLATDVYVRLKPGMKLFA